MFMAPVLFIWDLKAQLSEYRTKKPRELCEEFNKELFTWNGITSVGLLIFAVDETNDVIETYLSQSFFEIYN